MPRRKEVRWFTRGEFTTSEMLHEDEDMALVDGHRRHEVLIGKETSPYSFTSSFAPLSSFLEHHSDSSDRNVITIDGGPHTLWWPTQSPDGSYLPQDIPPTQLLRELQPHAKFLVTLNNPIHRMYSDYYFLNDNLRPVHAGSEKAKSAQQFHERATEQITLFHQCIDLYWERLQTQSATHSLNDKITNAKLNIDQKYRQNIGLWFRASQM